MLELGGILLHAMGTTDAIRVKRTTGTGSYARFNTVSHFNASDESASCGIETLVCCNIFFLVSLLSSSFKRGIDRESLAVA